MGTIIICGIVIVIAIVIADRIRQYIANVQKEQQKINEAIDKLSNEYIGSYSFSPADEQLIVDTVNCLNTICPHGLQERLNQYNTHEERKVYTEKVIQQLANAMGVKLEGVIVSDEMPDHVLGLFHEQGYLSINAVIMEADPERILMTIVHELRHGVQYQSCLKDQDHWGFSNETKATWYYNWNNYIDEPFELYKKQPLEYDANMFANAVIQSFKS